MCVCVCVCVTEPFQICMAGYFAPKRDVDILVSHRVVPGKVQGGETGELGMRVGGDAEIPGGGGEGDCT